MTWKLPTGTFEVNRGWEVQQTRLPFDPDDVEKKKAYGIELAKLKANDPSARLEAAYNIFSDAGSAGWIAHHWSSDPVVIAARAAYVPPPTPLLDKDALAAKLLECADESVMANGQKRYINEAKDRLGFYNLYSKIMGFIDKPDTTINQFGSNEMKIVLVKPDEKAEIKTIEHVKKVQETTSVTPLRIKAV